LTRGYYGAPDPAVATRNKWPPDSEGAVPMAWLRRTSKVQRSLADELNSLLETSVRGSNEFRASIRSLHAELGNLLRQELELPGDQPLQWTGALEIVSGACQSLDHHCNQLESEMELWFEKAPYQDPDVWSEVDEDFKSAHQRVYDYWFRAQINRLRFVRPALDPQYLFARELGNDRVNIVWSGLNLAWDEARLGVVRL
jgi:hypothetical protein